MLITFVLLTNSPPLSFLRFPRTYRRSSTDLAIVHTIQRSPRTISSLLSRIRTYHRRIRSRMPYEHATIVHNRTPHYWSNELRHELYHIPPEADVETWSRITTVVPEHLGGRVRVLKSHSTPGYLLYHIQADGTPIVRDWTLLPDLVLFNVPQYFIDHPNIESIWIETKDVANIDASSAGSDPLGIHTASDAASQGSRSSRSRSAAGSQASEEFQPDYALVIRRTECTWQMCNIIRAVQSSFFARNHANPPHANEFSCNLHGR